jgi:hypothetical protein
MRDHHKDMAHSEHKKHKHHPHDSMSAIPQFKEGHWEKKLGDISVQDGRYSSEMNQEEEYKEMVDGLTSYAKHHRAKH